MDYYRTLGVSRKASPADIKLAFRNLAKRFHPDKHISSSYVQKNHAISKFRQIVEAYEVLGNEERRAMYNREGKPHASNHHYSKNHTYNRQNNYSNSYSSNKSNNYGYGQGNHKFYNSDHAHFRNQNFYSKWKNSNFYSKPDFENFSENFSGRPKNFRFGSFQNIHQFFVRNFSKKDAFFHLAIGGVFVFGIVIGSDVGDYLWKNFNNGKSYEETIRALNKKNRSLENEKN